MGKRDVFFLTVVLTGLAFAGTELRRPSLASAAKSPKISSITPAVDEVDEAFSHVWAEKQIVVAQPAPDLVLMRRLSLALTGTIPSLEQVRRFEARPDDSRVDAWLEELLADRRCSDYLAERFARMLVGTEDGPFIQFRRRRFASWLSDAIFENRPYDAIVKELIAGSGLWTDRPATNFVTVTFDAEVQLPDPERLAARASRAFLGIRLDCAQCHDHPFQPWKQQDFRGLAAFFGGVYSSGRGIQDAENLYQPSDRTTKQPVKVEPRVPSSPELLTKTGTPREQLAGWVVEPKNPLFARATTNRMWGLIFGRPLVEPIDDLPASGEVPPELDLIARDFSSHGYDLKRLIRTIVATRAFHLGSALEEGRVVTEPQLQTWAVFPMTRLRPEQVAGALSQADSLTTLDTRDHWFLRLVAYTSRNDFVRRYGDLGEDEFDGRGGTILQRLLLMNGDFVREKTKDGGLTAAGRIAAQAPDDIKAIEAAYLVVLTRRPTREEVEHFRKRLSGSTNTERTERLADLCWTLLNATEFSWNY